MKRREMLPNGFVSWNGHAWPDCHVKAYNAIQERINAFLDGGMPVSRSLVDESYKAFCLYSNLDPM